MSAPGVVSGAARRRPARPGRAVGDRAERRRAPGPLARSIASTRYVVVVLPLVPVTASSVSASAAPKRFAAMTPSACRALGTVTTTPGNSTSSAGGSPLDDQRHRAARRRVGHELAPVGGRRPGPRRRDRPARPAASRRAPRRSAAPRTPRPRCAPRRPRAASRASVKAPPSFSWPCARTPRGRPRRASAGPGAGRCRSATPVARPSGSSNASSTPLLRAAWIACPRLMPGEVGDVDPLDGRVGPAPPLGPRDLVPLLGQRRILAERIVVQRQIGRRRLAARRFVGVGGDRLRRGRSPCPSGARPCRRPRGHGRRRRHVQVAQRLLGDLLEDGRRHRAAQVSALRLVDDDDDRQPRILDAGTTPTNDDTHLVGS